MEENSYKMGCCKKLCNSQKFDVQINSVLETLSLSQDQKRIIRKRFVKLVLKCQEKTKSINWKYNSCRVIISIGAMLLPTINSLEKPEYDTELFWASIATSLFVLISNNFISMFSLDKRYILYNTCLERFKSVGWQFLELSGMFANKTHTENWVPFWNEIEQIKRLQVSSEFGDSNTEKTPSFEEEEKHKYKETLKKNALNALKEQVSKNKKNKNNVNENNVNENNVNENNDVEINIHLDSDNEEVTYFDDDISDEKKKNNTNNNTDNNTDNNTTDNNKNNDNKKDDDKKENVI